MEAGGSVVRTAAAPPPVSEASFSEQQIIAAQAAAQATALAEARAAAPAARRARGISGDSARPSSQAHMPREGHELGHEHSRDPNAPAPAATPGAAAGSAERAGGSSGLLGAIGSMAIANLISRITGFARMVLLLAALGGPVASAFNAANTLPNMVTELVLGSVLTGMFMPLLARAQREDTDGGVGFIRRLLTVAATAALVITVAAVAAAPLLTRINLGEGQVNTSLAVAFAYLLLPQIFFYAVFSVALAVLNKNEVFKPGAWAPVWNNVIAIATLVGYVVLGSHIDADEQVNVLSIPILLLGLGTTLGVVVQAAILMPPLRRLGIGLRPEWGIDSRIRQFAPSAFAGFVYVLVSQVGLVITNHIGNSADASAIAIYTNNWLLLQVPYGILGVTLLTAINPRLADNGTAGRDKEVVADISLGTRLSIAGLLPIVSLMTAFGPVIASALFAYGRFGAGDAGILGQTLSASAFTIIPYAIVLLQQRVFYAREDYWTPNIVIAVVTVIRIVVSLMAPALASDPRDVVMILALANGLGWIVGAVVGYALLRRALGSLSGGEVLRSSGWVLLASVLGCAVAVGADWLLHLSALAGAIGPAGDIVRMAILTPIAFAVIIAVLMRSGLPELRPLTQRISALRGRIGRR